MSTLKLLLIYFIISVIFAVITPPADIPTERSKDTGELSYWPAVKPEQLGKYKK